MIKIVSKTKNLKELLLSRENDLDAKSLAIIYSKVPNAHIKYNDPYFPGVTKNNNLLVDCILAFNNKKNMAQFMDYSKDPTFKDFYNLLITGDFGDVKSGKIDVSVMYDFVSNYVFKAVLDDPQLNTAEMKKYFKILWDTKIEPQLVKGRNFFFYNIMDKLNHEYKLITFLKTKNWSLNETETKQIFDKYYKEIISQQKITD